MKLGPDDRWGAAIAGGLLFALPIAAGLYRGMFDWWDLLVALMGLAGLAAAGFGSSGTEP
jgi:hypothetical protein